MSQYKTGTASATANSNVVTGTNTDWSIRVTAGDLFNIIGSNGVYEVASIESDTSITLDRVYSGATENDVQYTITRDFTPRHHFPHPASGDDVSAIIARVIRQIDALLPLPTDGTVPNVVNQVGDPGETNRPFFAWAESSSGLGFSLVPNSSTIYLGVTVTAGLVQPIDPVVYQWVALFVATESTGAGAETFVELTDTPDALGTTGQMPRVNADGDALEFVDPPMAMTGLTGAQIIDAIIAASSAAQDRLFASRRTPVVDVPISRYTMTSANLTSTSSLLVPYPTIHTGAATYRATLVADVIEFQGFEPSIQIRITETDPNGAIIHHDYHLSVDTNETDIDLTVGQGNAIIIERILTAYDLAIIDLSIINQEWITDSPLVADIKAISETDAAEAVARLRSEILSKTIRKLSDVLDVMGYVGSDVDEGSILQWNGTQWQPVQSASPIITGERWIKMDNCPDITEFYSNNVAFPGNPASSRNINIPHTFNIGALHKSFGEEVELVVSTILPTNADTVFSGKNYVISNNAYFTLDGLYSISGNVRVNNLRTNAPLAIGLYKVQSGDDDLLMPGSRGARAQATLPGLADVISLDFRIPPLDYLPSDVYYFIFLSTESDTGWNINGHICFHKHTGENS